MRVLANSNKHKGGMATAIFKPFLWGLGTAAFAYMVSPRVKKRARPLMVKGINGAMGLVEKGKETVECMMQRKKENSDTEHSDTGSTVEYIRAGYDTTLDKIKAERDQALKEAQELRSAIDKLQEQINELKIKY